MNYQNNQLIISIILLLNLTLCLMERIDLAMPEISPPHNDFYACMKYKLNRTSSFYITEFIPNSSKNIVHHMLLYACNDVPDYDLWDCGGMETSKTEKSFPREPICRGQEQSIIYGWAMNAKKLVLPEDVSFKMAGNTGLNYIVLQVHYANARPFIIDKTRRDSSGVSIIGQDKPTNNRAGVLVMFTAGFIRGQSVEHFDSACQIKQNITIHPFAYRTHAHKLGLVNSGYVIKTNNSTGEQEWIELGRRSPQLPQMFVPIKNNITIDFNDILAARCTMKNYRKKTVRVG